jgi:hypothetical protein
MPVALKGNLPLSPKLSSTAQSAFVQDDLETGPLISLAQLCDDDDCIAIFNKYDVKILKNDKVIIAGTRMSDGLWSLPIKPPHHQANGVLRTDKPKQELATCLHAALGSPAPSTLLRAIPRHHLVTFPGLTTNLVTKHLPKSLAAVLGHQDQEAKHLCSTKALLAADTLPVSEPDLEPALDAPSHHIFAMLFDKVQIMKSCSDQTGRFPIPSSSRGNSPTRTSRSHACFTFSCLSSEGAHAPHSRFSCFCCASEGASPFSIHPEITASQTSFFCFLSAC